MFAFSKFNGDISEWTPSKVENMDKMFLESNFSNNINKWADHVADCYTKDNMFKESPLENNEPYWYEFFRMNSNYL